MKRIAAIAAFLVACFTLEGQIRPGSVLDDLADSETVAVVTHGGTINQLYHAFLKLPVKDGMFFSTADTGIHEWIVEQTERRVARSNYDAHTKDI